MEYEKAYSSNNKISVDIEGIVGLSKSVEKSVKSRYAVTDESKKTFSEEVIVEVPGFTKVRVSFQWKRIWQHGIVKAQVGSETINIPYQVIVGLTFDQSQEDE